MSKMNALLLHGLFLFLFLSVMNAGLFVVNTVFLIFISLQIMHSLILLLFGVCVCFLSKIKKTSLKRCKSMGRESAVDNNMWNRVFFLKELLQSLCWSLLLLCAVFVGFCTTSKLVICSHKVELGSLTCLTMCAVCTNWDRYWRICKWWT